MNMAAATPLDPHTVLATVDLGERLALLRRAAGRRLHSDEAAQIWLKLLAFGARCGTPAQLDSLLRQFLRLAPEHPKAEQLFAALFAQPAEPLPPGSLVFMITSCVRYLDKARRLRERLRAHGVLAHIVIGDPALPAARHDADLIALPVADTYEALPHKVLEGLTALSQRHGRIAVAKIDDDAYPRPDFDPQALAALAHRHGYAGLPLGDGCDRCYHEGKTSRELPIYGRRRHGRFARGAAYLLGPAAVEALVREWAFYPGEFDGEYFEDKAVGDLLRRRGINLAALDERTLGIGYEDTVRLYETAEAA